MSKRYGFPFFVSIVDGQILHLRTVKSHMLKEQNLWGERIRHLYRDTLIQKKRSLHRTSTGPNHRPTGSFDSNKSQLAQSSKTCCSFEERRCNTYSERCTTHPHPHPLEVWVGATKRNLQSTRASSLPPSTRKEKAIDSMDLGRSVAPCHFYFCCYFFETGTLPNWHGHSYTQARSNLMITWKNM